MPDILPRQAVLGTDCWGWKEGSRCLCGATSIVISQIQNFEHSSLKLNINAFEKVYTLVL
jgi:hypothetical protein